MYSVIFNKLKKIENTKYSLCLHFQVGKNELIVEPSIVSQINSISKLIPENISKIEDEILRRVDMNKKLYMASDFEKPFYEIPNFIYCELSDILDFLNIYIEDKSRPSDYGD